MTREITELWVWLAEEPGAEGICSMQLGAVHMPLVSGRRDLAQQMRPAAEIAHRTSGYPVRLVRFQRVEKLTRCCRCNGA